MFLDERKVEKLTPVLGSEVVSLSHTNVEDSNCCSGDNQDLRNMKQQCARFEKYKTAMCKIWDNELTLAAPVKLRRAHLPARILSDNGFGKEFLV